MNTGTVHSESTGLSIGNTAPTFDNRGVVAVNANKDIFFELAGTFVLDSDEVAAAATGGARHRRLDLEVKEAPWPRESWSARSELGVAPTAISFDLRRAGRGRSTCRCPTTLLRRHLKGWALVSTANIAATRGAAMPARSGGRPPPTTRPSRSTATFVEESAGTFSDLAKGFAQQIEVSDFVNEGHVLSRAPGFGLSGTKPSFDDRGTVEVDGTGAFASGGTFTLDRGGTIRAAGNSTSPARPSWSRAARSSPAL